MPMTAARRILMKAAPNSLCLQLALPERVSAMLSHKPAIAYIAFCPMFLHGFTISRRHANARGIADEHCSFGLRRRAAAGGKCRSARWRQTHSKDHDQSGYGDAGWRISALRQRLRGSDGASRAGPVD